jgi:uncharacterized phage protein (TIGR02218 family)|nr:MAG TPA_asm: minor tail protein [Caudoviricetes sp.]
MSNDTYLDYEHSQEDGSPVELYTINYSGKSWYYTTSVEDVVYDGKTFRAAAIRRGETEETSDASKSDIEVRLGRGSDFGSLFKVTPPSEPITLTIQQYHAFLGYQLPDKQTITVWKGRVTNVNWVGAELVITAESVFSSLLRVGVTRKFSRQCTHTLYGSACAVRRGMFSIQSTPVNILGVVVSIAHGKPVGWFNGGYIRYKNSQTGAVEYRQIVSSGANTITLNAIPLGMEVNTTEVTMFAGCDKTHTTCRVKFNNIENYGGQPFIPIQNPFGGSSIY